MFSLIRNVLGLLFPVVNFNYAPAVFTRLLATFDCKPHEMVLKINVGWP